VSIPIGKSLTLSLLGIFAAASVVELYVSIGLHNWATNISRSLGVQNPNIALTWDDWFLITVLVASVVGMTGLFLRARWGSIMSLIVFGSVSIWAMLLTVMPENLREALFSFWVDRWFAAILALLTLTAFRWLYVEQGRSDSNLQRRLA
jgi:hypothetical protein